MNEQHRIDIERKLSMLSSKVQKNSKIQSREEVGVDHLLHISKDNKIKTFIPTIGFRQADSEDRTVPRITTSTNLIGCMIGYAETYGDFFWGNVENNDKRKKVYKGGYRIYGIPYEYCVTPNNRLVYDQTASDEQWLITYNEETTQYKPITMGTFFISEIVLTANNDNRPSGRMLVYVEVNHPEGFALNNKIHLAKGHWVVKMPAEYNLESYKDSKAIEVQPASAADYMKAKKASADLLGYESPRVESAKFMNW